jgi:NADH-quinone oxidoreductase subunit C
MALEFAAREHDPLTLEQIERRVEDLLGPLATQIDRGELTIHCQPGRICEVLEACRDDEELAFDLLSDLSGVHWPGGEHFMEPQISTTGWPQYRLSPEVGRIEIAYHLRSTTRGHLLRVVVAVDDEDPRVPSVVDVYPTANFQEREAYDFFGVDFEGHPNLVRILMPDDWVGFPHRKDYPLGGVDTPYHEAHIPPPEERLWSRDVPHAGGEEPAS